MALMPTAEYLGLCMVDDLAYGDKSSRDIALKQCVMYAGGLSYMPFYKMLLGFE